MHLMSLIFDSPLQWEDLQPQDIVVIECAVVRHKSGVGDDRTEFQLQRVARLVQVADWSHSEQ